MVQYPSAAARRNVITQRIRLDLESKLHEIGYQRFSFYGEGGRGYMRMSHVTKFGQGDILLVPPSPISRPLIRHYFFERRDEKDVFPC